MKEQEKKRITDDMINNTLYKLTIVSYIKQGEKLYCCDENLFIDDSVMQSVSRYYYNQTRLGTTESIKSIIDDVIYITDFIYRNEVSVKKNEKEKEQRQIKEFFREANDKILKKFYVKMICAIDGLTNLKLTYNNDLQTKTNIDLEIKRLQTRIDRLDNVLVISI